jgi:outer membrane protein
MNRVGVARPLALGLMLCSASLCSVAFGAVVQAETLADAIAYAYQTNPTLQSQRAQLRGVDEGYVQARSAFGPTLQIQMSRTYTRQKLGSADQAAQLAANPAAPKFIDQNSGDAELVAEQNLYTGGKTQAEVNAAEARIRSGREALRAVEGNVILGVIRPMRMCCGTSNRWRCGASVCRRFKISSSRFARGERLAKSR